MNLYIHWILSGLVVLSFIGRVNAPEVLQPPTDVSVPAGEIATFPCKVGSLSLTWFINETFLNQLPSTVRDLMDPGYNESSDTYTLTFLAKPEYNTTRVQCVALDFEPTDREYSAVAHLYITVPSPSPPAETDPPTSEGTDSPTGEGTDAGDPTGSSTEDPPTGDPTGDPTDDSTGGGISDGTLAAIIVPATLVVVLGVSGCVGLCVCLWQRRNKQELHLPCFRPPKTPSCKSNGTLSPELPAQIHTAIESPPPEEDVPCLSGNGQIGGAPVEASSPSPFNTTEVHHPQELNCTSAQSSGPKLRRQNAPSGDLNRSNEVTVDIEIKELVTVPSPQVMPPADSLRSAPDLKVEDNHEDSRINSGPVALEVPVVTCDGGKGTMVVTPQKVLSGQGRTECCV